LSNVLDSLQIVFRFVIGNFSFLQVVSNCQAKRKVELIFKNKRRQTASKRRTLLHTRFHLLMLKELSAKLADGRRPGIHWIRHCCSKKRVTSALVCSDTSAFSLR